LTATTSAEAAPRAVVRPDRLRPLALDVARSEWTKLRTVRSTYWTLLVAAVGMVAFGALLDAAYVRHYTDDTAAASGFDPAGYSLSGFFLAQLAVGTLGVVVITSEYQTGSIRATLAATPQRSLVLLAKAVVFTIVAALTGLIASLASFLLGQAILAHKHIQTHLGDPAALRSVIGASLYLAVLGLLGLGLGALIRRTAGAIATLVGLILILPMLVQGLSVTWQHSITRYLPSIAGQAAIGHTKFTPPSHQLTPWTGLGLFAAYTAATLIAAAITLNRRDA
jgi:ABC-type transport system involved in multi-copper enzyme maturation permease subunit